MRVILRKRDRIGQLVRLLVDRGFHLELVEARQTAAEERRDGLGLERQRHLPAVAAGHAKHV